MRPECPVRSPRDSSIGQLTEIAAEKDSTIVFPLPIDLTGPTPIPRSTEVALMARLSKRLFLFLLSLSMLALGLGSPVTVLAAPANDNFDNAAAITSLPFAGVVNPVAARWFASSQIS